MGGLIARWRRASKPVAQSVPADHPDPASLRIEQAWAWEMGIGATRRGCDQCEGRYVQRVELDDDDHEVKADPPACPACGRTVDERLHITRVM